MTAFIISQGSDEERFADAGEAFDVAMDWSVSSYGDAVTVLREDNGKRTIVAEVNARLFA